MRLLYFYIHKHRVLSQLGMAFDPARPQESAERKYHLDFLVGVNGTGKSSVLRLLGRIFVGVQKSFDELGDIPFILEYWLDSKKKKVRIANIHPRDKTPLDRYFVTTVDGLNAEYETDTPDEHYLMDSIPVDLLPARIISYTTGNEAEWLEAMKPEVFDSSSLKAIEGMTSVERALKELPGRVTRVEEHEPEETNRYRFIAKDTLVLVALTGLLLHRTYQVNQSPLQDVFGETGIQALAGFSLQFDLSYVGQNERRDVWERLGKHATRAVRSGGKFVLVFDLAGANLARSLLHANGSALSFFEMLAGWYSGMNRILSGVTLFLERTVTVAPENGQQLRPPLQTWDWLSDGERSFLGRMCLFLLFGEVESLILLDEPEVHFNDYWKRHIVSTMHQVFERKKAAHVSHVVVATHSSISLSDVHPEDILVLEREGILTSTVHMPRIQTFGADPGDIMVHVFGAPQPSGEYAVEYIQQRIHAARTGQIQRDDLERELAHIAPGYWSYRVRRELLRMQ